MFLTTEFGRILEKIYYFTRNSYESPTKFLHSKETLTSTRQESFVETSNYSNTGSETKRHNQYKKWFLPGKLIPVNLSLTTEATFTSQSAKTMKQQQLAVAYTLVRCKTIWAKISLVQWLSVFFWGKNDTTKRYKDQIASLSFLAMFFYTEYLSSFW